MKPKDWKRSKVWQALTPQEKLDLINMWQFSEANDDEPDGAFFAMAEEEGYDAYDWGWYSETIAAVEADLEKDKS